MKLQHKTRGDSSPQGKPRVYFSYHPADFGLYFQPISREILEKQNCAIWYDTEPEADYDREAFRLSLSQMQLFVIPVTTRFLCQESREAGSGPEIDHCPELEAGPADPGRHRK